MKLCVIRHGLTNCNVEKKYNGKLDEDINEIGIEQARNTQKIIKDLDIDLIICSPWLRARHTCDIINMNNVTVIYDKRIEERDCGIYTGKEIGEFYNTDFWNYYSKTKVEGLETIEDLFKRVNSFLDEIKEKYNDKNILLVTHGGVARAVYFYFNEIPKDGMIKDYGAGNCEVAEYNF